MTYFMEQGQFLPGKEPNRKINKCWGEWPSIIRPFNSRCLDVKRDSFEMFGRMNESESQQVMEEVHAGECGPHMNGATFAKKIMRQGYFWITMESYYFIVRSSWRNAMPWSMIVKFMGIWAICLLLNCTLWLHHGRLQCSIGDFIYWRDPSNGIQWASLWLLITSLNG